MNTTESIQAYLDSLSQLPGSILYRDTISWKALPPGNSGDILTLDADLFPYWDENRSYRPAMLQFLGDSTYYTQPCYTAGNKFTVVGKFICYPRTGSSQRIVLQVHENSASTQRLNIMVRDTAHSLNPNKMQLFALNSTGGVIASYASTISVVDGLPHSFLWAVDGDAGQSRFVIDGVTESPIIQTTGIMRKESMIFDVGGRSYAGGMGWNGQLGYIGYSDLYLPYYTNFFSPTNRPLPMDMSTWSGFGAQPVIWNEAADFERNYGSGPDFARVGQPYVGLGGNL